MVAQIRPSTPFNNQNTFMRSMDNVRCHHFATNIMRYDTREDGTSRHTNPDRDTSSLECGPSETSLDRAQTEVEELIEPPECAVQGISNLGSVFVATKDHVPFSSIGRDNRPNSSSQRSGMRPASELHSLSVPNLVQASITPSVMLNPRLATLSRNENHSFSASGSLNTYQDGPETFAGSALSYKAISDMVPNHSQQSHPTLLNTSSVVSCLDLGAPVGSDSNIRESQSFPRMYAHELMLHKDGYPLAGTLRALVEHLTGQDPPPDPTFVTTFYMAFRVFTNASELAHALVSRCQIMEANSTQNLQTLKRVYHFFKRWLQSYWRSEHDMPAIELICTFAKEKLQEPFPGLGGHLVQLAKEASQRKILDGLMKPVSSRPEFSSFQDQGKNKAVSIAVDGREAFRIFRATSTYVSQRSLLDFNPLEVARELSIIQSRNFCAIKAEELINLEWAQVPQRASNVRAMICFATDLSDITANTILSLRNVKRRAAVIQQWIEIGKSCLDLNNYDCLMAIVCSLNSSPIRRLQSTWQQVSRKAKRRLEEFEDLVSVSRNYAVLRQRLQTSKAPCLPFIGIYLKDLTFIDATLQDTRILSNEKGGLHPMVMINFDKHMRSAKIINQLQRHQMPYQLQPDPEVQKWLEMGRTHVQTSKERCNFDLWRLSMELESKVKKKDQRLSTAHLLHTVSPAALHVLYRRLTDGLSIIRNSSGDTYIRVPANSSNRLDDTHQRRSPSSLRKRNRSELHREFIADRRT